jgi:hypothetical protein
MLNKPYPYKIAGLSDIKFHLGIGLFVAIFLISFQPFGLSLWETEYKILKIAGYGLMSFIGPVILVFLKNFIINERIAEYKYKVWHEVIWLTSFLAIVAVGCLIYSNILGITSLSLRSYLIFLSMVLPVGMFPIGASIWLKYQRFVQLNQVEAQNLENELKLHTTKVEPKNEFQIFIAENEKDTISIRTVDLLYIESMDNYSQFVFQKNGQITKTLLRGALKLFEGQIKDAELVRCHRSFIVNLSNVAHIEGNAQGYQLTMHYGDQKVPVARSYGPGIKGYFQSNR